MLRNYLIVAVRSLLRHRLHTAINLAGLGLGLAFCLLAWRFASQEWSFDRFHANADRIYRLYLDFPGGPNGERMRSADVLEFAFGPVLEESSPAVERVVRMASSRGQSSDRYFLRVVYDGKGSDEKFLLADPGILEVFDFPLERGDGQSALSERNSIVLSHAMAARLFGDEDPLGRQLSITSQAHGTQEDFVITGVAAPLPANSSIHFNMILPFQNVGFLFSNEATDWEGSCTAFCLLAPGSTPSDVAPTLDAIVADNMLKEGMPEGFLKVEMQPLSDVHQDAGMMR